MHFEWLDLRHGADCFRRRHREKADSGGLMAHKATHHFDLVNWWLGTKPETVYAQGGLFFYGDESGPGTGPGRLLALWWIIVHRGDSLTSWTLAPSLLLIGFGTGLAFVPIFDFILTGATTEEVGTGAVMLNAVQQFSGAIGVAALSTVFFARVNHGGTPAFDHADELVTGLATGPFLITFALVRLLPKHAQQAEN